MSGTQGAAGMRSIRPYKTGEEYLYAMKEDLAEWLKELYGLEINVRSFVDVLETGTWLCRHANNITQVARDFSQKYLSVAQRLLLPTCGTSCNELAQPGTFQARDNVSNFIHWCRKEMDIKGKPLGLWLSSPSLVKPACPLVSFSFWFFGVPKRQTIPAPSPHPNSHSRSETLAGVFRQNNHDFVICIIGK